MAFGGVDHDSCFVSSDCQRFLQSRQLSPRELGKFYSMARETYEQSVQIGVTEYVRTKVEIDTGRRFELHVINPDTSVLEQHVEVVLHAAKQA